MFKYNLKVNLSKRRSKENTYDDKFKFGDIKEIYNLDKWIGDVKEIRRDNVSKGNTVFYKVSYQNEDYHLINWELMKELCKNISNQYKNKYLSIESWLDKNRPPLDSDNFFTKDPVFAEKVIINDENSKIYFVGDIHSSMHSLIDILKDLRKKGYFIGNTFKLKKNIYLFFLGDLIDRGPYGIEVLCIALILKEENSNNVFIINGNHEDAPVYEQYGFLYEMIYQFNDDWEESEELVRKTLYYLPSVIYLKLGDKYFHLCHGAILDPDTLTQKRSEIIKYLKDDNIIYHYIESNNHKNTLKWGDLTMENGYSKDYHGRDKFGPDIISSYLDDFGISSLITGHQDIENLLVQPNKNSKYLKKFNKKSNKVTLIEEDLIPLGPDRIVFKYCKYSAKFADNQKCNFPYNLYAPFITDSTMAKESSHINLDPLEDFYSLVTSTATISKNLTYNCYLELTFKKDLKQIIKNCN